MAKTNMYDLLLPLLPNNISHDEIFKFKDDARFKNNPSLACGCALAICKKINWNAYLENNPDVKESGMQPLVHFLKNGIFEGRKLYSFHELYKNDQNCPKVTAIVPNFNNAIFLEKCLNSLVNQTLPDIEIIIVDDGSTDLSAEIIKKYIARDSRIKFIKHEVNMSQHMAKKHALEIAQGKYVMFLDSDDFYCLDACEKAYRAAEAGYDAVCFGVGVINHGQMSSEDAANTEKWLTNYYKNNYSGDDVLDLAFRYFQNDNRITNKIIRRDICARAFSELEDGFFPLADDYYQFLAIFSHIRSMGFLKDKLYMNRYGTGTTGLYNNNKGNEDNINFGNILGPISRYCKKYGKEKYYLPIKIHLFKPRFLTMLAKLSEKEITPFFDTLCEQFGTLFVVKTIMQYGMKKFKEIARKFKYYTPTIQNHDKKIVGIFYHRLSVGGIENTIGNLCRLLPKDKYEVVLFVEERSDYDIVSFPDIKIFYIHKSSDKLEDQHRHVTDLYDAAKFSKLTHFIYMGMYESVCLWDTMILQLMGVNVIGSYRIEFVYGVVCMRTGFTHEMQLDMIRCMKKVFCLSKYTELYLRAQGIDALYIPNAIRDFYLPLPVERKKENIIVVVARLKDRLKRIEECLCVLEELKKYCSDVKMVFIGDFDQSKPRLQFMENIERRGLKDNVEITGWTLQPEYHLDRAKVLFSASYLEGFPNGIAEAQARGLPVVMYHLDVMIAENNPSVIRIPQGDREAAAKEIARLLMDENLRGRLSDIALRQRERYSDKRFVQGIMNLINTMDTMSFWHDYKPVDYITAVNSLAYYAGRDYPAT